MREGYYRRRDVFLGGLTIGAALTGGLLFTSSSQWIQGADAAKSRDNGVLSQAQLVLPWNGLDFTWLPDNNRLAIASASGLGIVETSNGQLNWRKWPQIASPSLQNTSAIYWSSDGTKVLSMAATALLVQDVLTGQTLWSLRADQAVANIAALSPNGSLLVLSQSPSVSTSSHHGPSMQIWNVQERRVVVQFSEHSIPPLAVKSILWSPDNTRIATTSPEGIVQVWQASDGRLLWHTDALTIGFRQAISWSPDRSTIAFVANGSGGQALLELWDAHSGQLRFQTPALVGFLTDQLRQDDQVTWSPDGTRISFSVQTRDGSLIEVWSVQRGQRLFSCQPVSGQSTASIWSPDGKYLAAGQTIVGGGELIRGDNGERSVIQFWDTGNGQALFTYSAPKSPQRLTWSPNGRSLAIITPRAYGALANSSCSSFCRYGYNDYALEVFRVA